MSEQTTLDMVNGLAEIAEYMNDEELYGILDEIVKINI